MLIGDDDIRYGANQYETVLPMEILESDSPWSMIVRTASLLANVTAPSSDIADTPSMLAEDQMIRRLAVLIWVRYCGTIPVDLTVRMSQWHAFNLMMVSMMLLPDARMTVSLNTDDGLPASIMDVGDPACEREKARSRLALSSTIIPVNERYVWDSPAGSIFWNIQGLRKNLQETARAWCAENKSRLMSVKDIISLLEDGLTVFYADQDKWQDALASVLTLCGEN